MNKLRHDTRAEAEAAGGAILFDGRHYWTTPGWDVPTPSQMGKGGGEDMELLEGDSLEVAQHAVTQAYDTHLTFYIISILAAFVIGFVAAWRSHNE